VVVAVGTTSGGVGLIISIIVAVRTIDPTRDRHGRGVVCAARRVAGHGRVLGQRWEIGAERRAFAQHSLLRRRTIG